MCKLQNIRNGPKKHTKVEVSSSYQLEIAQYSKENLNSAIKLIIRDSKDQQLNVLSRKILYSILG